MLQQYHRDPNRGPLKLDHDLTPKDLGHYNSEVDAASRQDNYRFQGYPNGKMEKPRNATRNSVEGELLTNRSDDKYYGLPNHFDTNRPKVFDHPQGFQYGSDGAPLSRPGPKPIRDPFQEKTSAEVHKYRARQEEVEQDIQLYKQEKKMKIQERETEKKEDMQQLKAYDPWGRPGGGAPMITHNKKLFTEVDEVKIKSPTKPDSGYLKEYGDFNDNFGRPGGGAPRMTESGTVRAEVTADPQIRFQDTKQGRQAFDKEVRYKQDMGEKTNYGHHLDEQIQQKKLHEQELRITDLKKELETMQHDPYGKPGGGAQNKSPSEPTDGKMQQFEFYDPWGKGAGQPIRDQYGDIRRFKHSEKDTGVLTNVSKKRIVVDIDDPTSKSIEFNSKGGGGAPVITDSGNVKTRMEITMKRDDKGDATIREEVMYGASPRRMPPDDPEHPIYDPWGRDGGGAPVRAADGQIKASVFGRMRNENNISADANAKQEKAHIYLNELQQEMDSQRTRKAEQERSLKFGAGELAAVIKQGLVGRPKRDPNTGMLLDQSLNTSDVTRDQTNTRPQRTDQSSLYHTELERAAEERKRFSQLDRLKEKQESQQHQTTMNDFWGRPGAGAPLETTKKSKLDNTLGFSPRRERDYQLAAPFATESEEVF